MTNDNSDGREARFPPGASQAVPDGDPWLDSLIEADAGSMRYIEDDGFTAGVIAKLPALPSANPHRWIVPGMGVLGFLVGIVSLSGGENLLLNLMTLASFESFSVQKLLAAAIPLGILYWLGVGAAWQER